MESKIVNLTRKFLPKISTTPQVNRASLNAMPEMRLHEMIKSGDQSILRIDMNRCGAAIIKKGGINTVYTDSLAGCNSVGAALTLNTGDTLFMQSHYVPTNVAGQISALEKQLKVYQPYFSSAQEPRLFFNIRGYKPDNVNLEPVPNPIVDGVVNLFSRFFSKKPKVDIVPYQNQNRPAFFSTANIFQFDPQNLKNVKVTNVGEVERFVTLG